MIVYGDPQFATTAGTLRAALRTRLEMLRQHGNTPDVDELRTLLILLGQFEQAVDDLPHPGSYQELHAATDYVAEALVARLMDQAPQSSCCLRVEEALQRLEIDDTIPLAVKIPEGFAFYTLYPEQYHLAALRWAAGRAPVAPVIVAGIRSIGTSLAAVVAQSLAAYGWPVRRISLRPSGHPFARETRIDPAMVAGAGWGLVVDEGPGISGSSMAAVGIALVHAGMDRSRIAFLPSHGGEPSSTVPEEVRGWWQHTPRLFTPLNDLRLGGRPLPDALAAATEELTQEPVVAIEDCGGGLWRRYAYAHTDDWPAAYAPFERTKYRCTIRNGKRVLWKFAGLAGSTSVSDTWHSMAEAEAATLTSRAARGLASHPLTIWNGFVAVEWREGQPLEATEATSALIENVGRFIARVAGPSLTVEEQEAGVTRLAELLYWNTWELLGDEVAARTRAWAEAAAATIAGPLACYGDGHLAPQEWLRLVDGTIHKVDAAGHSLDHSVIGRQPIVWDLAGAMVEWSLEEDAVTPLFTGYQAAGGPPFAPAMLAFFRLAYLAFRAGQAELCAGMSGHDPDEQARLWTAKARYAAVLEHLLVRAPPVL